MALHSQLCPTDLFGEVIMIVQMQEMAVVAIDTDTSLRRVV